MVLGDVSGKGAAAAVVTALVRHVVRAEMLRSGGGSPAAALAVAPKSLEQTLKRYRAQLSQSGYEDSPASFAQTLAQSMHALDKLTQYLKMADRTKIETQTVVESIGRSMTLVFSQNTDYVLIP